MSSPTNGICTTDTPARLISEYQRVKNRGYGKTPNSLEKYKRYQCIYNNSGLPLNVRLHHFTFSLIMYANM